MHILPSATLALLLVAAPALGSQPSAPSGDPPAGTVLRHVEEVYYEVTGQTVGELAASLHANGPALHGRRFFGQTRWEVGAEYAWVERPAGCAIEDLTVRVRITLLLPRWRDAHRAPRELRRAWHRFADALGQHEDGHRQLAEEAAEAVRARLASLWGRTCDGMEKRARREVAAVLEAYQEENIAYDAHTGHGASQGATWPPRPRLNAGWGP